MRMIVAKRRNVIRKFTEIAWKNLGANKHGWVEVQDQQVSNSIAKPTMKEVPAVKAEKTEVEVPVKGKISVEEKKEFVEKHLSEYSKTAIKDFLDSVGVAYNKKDSEDVLRVALAEFLEYSEEKLNQHTQ